MATSGFNVLSDLIEELNSDLGETEYKMVKKMLDDKMIKSKLNTEILDYLKDYTEMKRFVSAFKDACNIQICFIIDITGSMNKYYDNFKNKVFGSIIDGVLSAVNKGNKRYAFIGYRERDESHVFVQLTSDLDVVRKAIKEAEIKDGGDPAEDIQYAYELFINNINFQQKGTRIIIHVADMPCHGHQYHENDIEDIHPDRSSNLPRLLTNIVNNFSCFYWFVKVTKHTDKMIAEFNRILAETCENEAYNKICEIDLTNLKGDLTKHLTDCVRNLLQSSILSNSMLKDK